jgi:hypothetical protein
MLMKYASDILLHFVGRAHRDDPQALVDTCESILTKGLRFTPQPITFGSGGGLRPFSLGFHAVCFTDIPLRLTGPHVARYGTCAIGVTKPLVKKWGGNPVQYLVDGSVPHDAAAPENFRGKFNEVITIFISALNCAPELRRKIKGDHWLDALSDAQLEQARRELNWIAASHLKPMFDLGPEVDTEDELSRRDRYYMEREWRVALTDGHKNHAHSGLGLVTHDAGEYYLPIPRDELRIVVVPNRFVAGHLKERLRARLWDDNKMPPIMVHADTLDL